MSWITIGKPSPGGYTDVSDYKTTYDSNIIAYDDNRFTYDESSADAYVMVPKPTSSTYTYIPKPT